MSARAPNPLDVDGYRQALADRLLPAVAATPPRPLPGRSAAAHFNRWLVLCVGTFGGSIAIGLVVAKSGATSPWLWLLVAAALTAALVGSASRLGRVGDRLAAELQHGYTTHTITQGTYWLPSLRRPFAAGPRPVPWNYAGTWVLDDSGRPVGGVPDPTVLPPGLYPSPRRPGEFELWSGAAWTGNFRTQTQVEQLLDGR
ncbi:MAG: hypothetical protein QM679_06920 [Patulibacter sp.]